MLKQEMKMVALPHTSDTGYDLEFLSLDTAKKVRDFHRSFPMYCETPLAHLPETASALPFFNNILSTNEYAGISNVEKQFNSYCRKHFDYQKWRDRQ